MESVFEALTMDAFLCAQRGALGALLTHTRTIHRAVEGAVRASLREAAFVYTPAMHVMAASMADALSHEWAKVFAMRAAAHTPNRTKLKQFL